MYLRKFYDMAAPGTFAGAKPSDFGPMIPVVDNPEPTIEEPTPQPEAAKEPPAEQSPTEVPAEVPAGQVTPEAPKETPKETIIAPKPPVEEPVPAVKIENVAEPAAPPPPPKTKEEILKEMGYDDYAIEALKFYKETGDLTPYVKVKSINYKDMAPEQVMWHDLQEQYPELNEDALKIIYRDEVEAKYLLDPDVHSVAEIEAAKARLKRIAAPIRQRFIEYQDKFKAPERNVEAEQQQRIETERQEQAQALQQITNDPATKQLLTGKWLAFDVGESGEQYKFETANPSDVLGGVTDGENWVRATHVLDKTGQLVLDAKGKPIPDVKKLLKASAFLKHEKEILKGAYELGFAKGQKQQVLESINPDTATPNAPVEPESLKKAFLERGRKTNWVV